MLFCQHQQYVHWCARGKLPLLCCTSGNTKKSKCCTFPRFLKGLCPEKSKNCFRLKICIDLLTVRQGTSSSLSSAEAAPTAGRSERSFGSLGRRKSVWTRPTSELSHQHRRASASVPHPEDSSRSEHQRCVCSVTDTAQLLLHGALNN